MRSTLFRNIFNICLNISKKRFFRYLSFLLAIIIFSIILLPHETSAQYRILRQDVYTLHGDVTLIYEREWSSAGRDATDTFTHSYNLGLSGFIVDPRLMTFEINPTFRQEINKPGDTLNFYGLNIRTNILNKPAIRGFFKNFPQPVQLKFSYFKTVDIKTVNYGLSLAFDVLEAKRIHRDLRLRQEERLKGEQEGQTEGEKGKQQGQQGQQEQGVQRKRVTPALGPSKWIPLPVFYLDYDRYSYTTSDFKATTDHLNLRALDNNINREYRFEYDLYRYGGEGNYTTQYLNIEANYRFFWTDVERVEILNRMLLTDYSDRTTFSLSNRSSWFKRFGPELRDNMTVSGGGNYFQSESASNYNLGGSVTYNKYFSERFRDMVSGSVGYGKSDIENIYTISVSNGLEYNISRFLTFSKMITLTQTELGTSFLGNVGFAVKSFILLSPYYEYSTTAETGGRLTYHKFNFDFSGRLFRRLGFTSQNYYKIAEFSGIEPYNEKTLSLRGDIYLSLWRLNINLGANSISVKKTDGEEADIGLTTIYSNLTAPISRRIFLTVSSYYQIEKGGKKLLSIKPILTWYYRLINLTAEYELRKTEDVTDHRVLLRLTRNFARPIRRFLW